jgi:hypothetical protein
VGVLKGPADAGQGGKRGHSNMEHWEDTEEIKSAARKRRRSEGKAEIREGLTDNASSGADLQITFLPTHSGGRSTRVQPGSRSYRPHVRLIGGADALGIEFVSGANLKPGASGVVRVRFLYDSLVSYESLKAGVRFEVLEGPRVVGHGEVIRTLDLVEAPATPNPQVPADAGQKRRRG